MNSATCLSKCCPTIVCQYPQKEKCVKINVISANQCLKYLQYGKQQCTIGESLSTHLRNSEDRRNEN